MQVKEIADKNAWEEFFLYQPDKTFLQSWAWGEVQQRMGNAIWRLGVYEGDRLVGAAMASKVQAKRGTFLMVQHMIPMQQEAFVAFVREMEKICISEGASFMRMAPLWERNNENERVFQELGFREAPLHANAYESSWKLDITASGEELFKNMRKTTRYLIRQTQNNPDITVKQSVEEKDVEEFYALSRAAGERQKFTPFAKNDTEAEISVFQKDNAVSLFFGLYKGKPVAGALVVFWAGIGFYHQAASLGEYAKYSVPYLVQWEAIQEAKRRGCKLYDFWGYVDPQKYPRHPWAGPTLFKMGFGGKPKEYVKTQDYPLSWKYWPTAVFEIIRAKRRGL